MYRLHLVALWSAAVVLLVACGGAGGNQELPTVVSLDTIQEAEPVAATEEPTVEPTRVVLPTATDPPPITLEPVQDNRAAAVPEAVPEEEPPTDTPPDPNAPVPTAAPTIPDISILSGFAFAAEFPSTGGTMELENPYTVESIVDPQAAYYGNGRVQIPLRAIQGPNRIATFLIWQQALVPATYEITFAEESSPDSTAPFTMVGTELNIGGSPPAALMPGTASGTFTLENADLTSLAGTFQFTGRTENGPVGMSVRFIGITAYEIGDS